MNTTRGRATTRRRTRWMWLAAVVLLLSLIVFATGYLLRDRGLDTAANIAQLVSLLIPAIAVAPQAVAWWRKAAVPTVATPEEVARAKEILAMVMARQWQEEALIRALDDPDPIPVRWQLTDHEAVMDVALNRTPGVLTVASSADVEALITEFHRLRRRRLVILGGAGAGKTTLAVQMLLALLARRPAGAADPVPVLLSVASWDTARHDRVHDWVAERLTYEYSELSAAGLQSNVVHALVAQGHILPVIDGLDEAPPEVQNEVITALNRSMSGSDQLILTSRTEAFTNAVQAAGRALTSAVVIEPVPLTPAAAAEYLLRCLPPRPDAAWQRLLDRLGSADSTSPLAGVTASPLGLWLIRVAYISPRQDPTPLLDEVRFTTTAALRSHLFDRLIAGSIEARPPSDNPGDLFRPRRLYSPDDATRWLRFLAVNLDENAVRDFDWTRDLPEMRRPARWPERAAAVLERVVPSATTLLHQVKLARLRVQAASAAAALAVVIGVILVVSWVVGLLVGLPFGPRAGSTAHSLAFLLLLVGVIGAVSWVVVLTRYYAVPEDVPWYLEVSRVRDATRSKVIVAVRVLSYCAAYALITGLVSGGVVAAVVGGPEGRVVGYTVAGLAAVLIGILFVDDLARAPGTGARVPWYGVSPMGAIRQVPLVGVVLGAVAGIALALAFSNDSHMLTYFGWFGVVCGVVFTAFYLVVRGVIAPLIFATAALVLAVPQWLLGRKLAGSDGGGGRDASLVVWQQERAAQLIRFLRVAGVVAIAAGVGAVAWRLGTQRWGEPDLSKAAVAQWMRDNLTGGDLDYHCRLRYVAAVIAGLAATAWHRPPYRRWGHWLLAAAVGALVVWQWPSVLSPDTFEVHLRVTVEDLEALARLDGTARLGDAIGSFHRADDLDLAAFARDDEVRLAIFGIALVAGLMIVGLFVGTIENGQPKTWWSTTLAGAPFVARKLLPLDLMRFLDDAHRLGLLRAIGTVYQFRHAEFQDHLAGGSGPFAAARRLMARTRIGKTVNDVMDGDAVAVAELTAISRRQPRRLEPYHRALLDSGVFAPPELFLAADEDIIETVIGLVDRGEVTEADRLDDLLCLVAQSRTERALMALRAWQGSPPARLAELGTKPIAYARRAGWVLTDGNRRHELCSDTAYALTMRPAPQAASPDECPWCGSPLWTVLDLDTVADEVAAAVKHTGWDGRLRIVTCPACVDRTPLWTEVTPHGDASWATRNVRPGGLRSVLGDPPPLMPDIGPERDTAYLASARTTGGSTLGGHPDWLGEPAYLDCAECGRAMNFIGLLSGADLGRSGAYYLFLHAQCGLAAVCRQTA